MNRDVNKITIAPFINTIVSDDLAKARRTARLPLAYYIGGMGNFYRDSVSRLGFAEEADMIHRLWQAGRRKEAINTVSDTLVDAVAICGSLDECKRRINQVYTYGATLPLVPLPSDGTIKEKIRLLEVLME